MHVTDDSWNQKTYTSNIYLQFQKKCLQSYDFNFDFNQLLIPERTKGQTPASWNKALRKHGLNIERNYLTFNSKHLTRW